MRNLRVLIAHSPGEGPVLEVSRIIGDELTMMGFEAVVKWTKHVPVMPRYHAAVIGGCRRMSGWDRGASRFARDNEQSLKTIPVWLFSTIPRQAHLPVTAVRNTAPRASSRVSARGYMAFTDSGFGTGFAEVREWSNEIGLDLAVLLREAQSAPIIRDR